MFVCVRERERGEVSCSTFRVPQNNANKKWSWFLSDYNIDFKFWKWEKTRLIRDGMDLHKRVRGLLRKVAFLNEKLEPLINTQYFVARIANRTDRFENSLIGKIPNFFEITKQVPIPIWYFRNRQINSDCRISKKSENQKIPEIMNFQVFENYRKNK